MTNDRMPAKRHKQRGRILVVCTANQCRSPMAAAILEERLRPLEPGPVNWMVRSAGTSTAAGRPMDGVAASVLEARGLDVADFRTTPLNARSIRDADLVLTAERSHRAAVVALEPDALARTFTLLQFARLLHVDAPDEIARPDGRRLVAGLLRRAHWARPLSEPGGRLDDLDDPIGRGPRFMHRTAARIDESVGTIVAAIADAATTRAPA